MIELKAKVDAQLYCCDNLESSEVTNLQKGIRSHSKDPLKEKIDGYDDALFYIYTSGTTGWEKFQANAELSHILSVS